MTATILMPIGGGTGVSNPTAHTVLVGEGASPVGTVGPGAANYPLLGGGSSADPAFHQPRGNTSVTQMADSTTNPTTGDLAKFDANGNIVDAGVAAATVANESVVSFLNGLPGDTFLLLAYKVERALTLPANMAGSYGRLTANPAATAVYTLKKNGSSVGTISVSTGGAFTFATTGGTSQSFAAGDEFALYAPSPQDSTLSDVGLTILFNRV
jgi:hypothetical protein